MFVGNVSIYLRSTDVGVAEHCLYRANIGAVHEKVCGETMAHGVWADVFSDASETSVFCDHALDATRRQATIITRRVDGASVTTVADKQRRKAVSAFVEVVSNMLGSGVTDEDRSVFLAFSAHHELAPRGVDVVAVETTEFGDAQPAREEEFEDCSVAQAWFVARRDLFAEAFDFIEVQKGDLFADGFGKLNLVW